MDHGDLPVMDGSCQDEFLHCTSPSLADRRVNITYRWIRYHPLVCRLTAGVLGSMPTCARGSPILEAASGCKRGMVELCFPGGPCGSFMSDAFRASKHRFLIINHRKRNVFAHPFTMWRETRWVWKSRFLFEGSWEFGKTPGHHFIWIWCGICVPYMLAWRRLLNLPDPDAKRVLRSNRAKGENTGKNKMKPHLLPGFPFLFSR